MLDINAYAEKCITQLNTNVRHLESYNSRFRQLKDRINGLSMDIIKKLKTDDEGSIRGLMDQQNENILELLERIQNPNSIAIL